MYRSRPGEVFTLGHDAHGADAAATHWFLAEGATGSFFDTYVLIANPGATPVDVTASFLRDDGTVVTRTYTVRENARFSIYVDAIPGLEATSLATTIDSSGPVVVERAMYWPTGFFDYYEGHVSAARRPRDRGGSSPKAKAVAWRARTRTCSSRIRPRRRRRRPCGPSCESADADHADQRRHSCAQPADGARRRD